MAAKKSARKTAAKKKSNPKNASQPLYSLRLTCRDRLDGETAMLLAEKLEDAAAAVSLHNKESTDGDDWILTLTSQGKPDTADIRRRLKELEAAENEEGPDLRDLSARIRLRTEKLPPKDWLRHVHDNFPPVTIGKFFVRGSHYKRKTPAGLIPLHIDAATAFGSGEHETTKGCLLAFENMAVGTGKVSEKRVFRNVLDMGCGSGILGIAITKLWPGVALTAVDIDPEAVTVTKRHAAMNKTRLQAAAGDGYATPLARKNGPYDLIAANILAGPLIAMAPACRRALKKNGFCVLSGLLQRQEKEVTEAYKKQGLVPAGSIAAGDWRTLVFQRP